MAEYRFHYLSPDQSVALFHDAFCRNDDDALARARSLRHAHDIEVWQGRRIVGRIERALGAVAQQ